MGNQLSPCSSVDSREWSGMVANWVSDHPFLGCFRGIFLRGLLTKFHQRAMTSIVLDLKRRNWSSDKIGKQLGMDPDEVLRLAQIGGLADVFADAEFSEAWEPTASINEDDNIVAEDENA
jgi:hypothetical protein